MIETKKLMKFWGCFLCIILIGFALYFYYVVAKLPKGYCELSTVWFPLFQRWLVVNVLCLIIPLISSPFVKKWDFCHYEYNIHLASYCAGVSVVCINILIFVPLLLIIGNGFLIKTCTWSNYMPLMLCVALKLPSGIKEESRECGSFFRMRSPLRRWVGFFGQNKTKSSTIYIGDRVSIVGDEPMQGVVSNSIRGTDKVLIEVIIFQNLFYIECLSSLLILNQDKSRGEIPLHGYKYSFFNNSGLEENDRR